MSLQDIFYIVGIITMSLYVLLLFTLVIILFYIKRKLTDIITIIENKMEIIKDIISHPKETAAVVGGVLANKAIHEASKLFKAKR